MTLFFHFPGGRRMEAVVLGSSPTRMRIVVRGQSETLEVRRQHGRWYSERGQRVEFDAILAANAEQAPAPRAEAMAAGASGFACN